MGDICNDINHVVYDCQSQENNLPTDTFSQQRSTALHSNPSQTHSPGDISKLKFCKVLKIYELMHVKHRNHMYHEDGICTLPTTTGFDNAERQQSAQKIYDYLQILNMIVKANMTVHIETVPAEELVR